MGMDKEQTTWRSQIALGAWLYIVAALIGAIYSIAYDAFHYARHGYWASTTLLSLSLHTHTRLPLTDNWLGINRLLIWIYNIHIAYLAGISAVIALVIANIMLNDQ